VTCLRCASPMFGIRNPDGSAKGTCSGCSQHLEVARCSKCGDQKCLKCYNKARTVKPGPVAQAPIIPHDEDP